MVFHLTNHFNSVLAGDMLVIRNKAIKKCKFYIAPSYYDVYTSDQQVSVRLMTVNHSLTKRLINVIRLATTEVSKEIVFGFKGCS